MMIVGCVCVGGGGGGGGGASVEINDRLNCQSDVFIL